MSHLAPTPPGGDDRVTAADIPGLARVVAVSSFRIGAWAAATGVHAGKRAVDVALHPSRAAELAEDLRAAASVVSKALAGEEVDGRGRSAGAPTGPIVRVMTEPADPVPPGAAPQPHVNNVHNASRVNPLHEAGQELLRRSRDVWSEDRGHPAYARIIEELAPDEGRILLLLLRKGPQASVDVRAGGFFAASTTLLQQNLTMIGALAGCRYVDRVPSYLHNLERLGLIWFSSDALRDPTEYQVLEAQPDVVDALHLARRTRVVRRSIHLTPFGEDFCRDGLGLHLTREELGSVPRHGNPTTD